ncbi:30S ribosomal protein S8 [Pelagibacterales bacterium SAG-MED32]|nr:30S ribosomal protein S8 [Pelagibacterales bacterium SAG-MED32]
MSLSDPIGDMIARVKNAQARNHKKVNLPSSNFKSKIADILKNEGFIRDFKVLNEQNKNILSLELKYHSGNPVISNFERVSKPGRRIFSSADSLPKINNGLNVEKIVNFSCYLLNFRTAIYLVKIWVFRVEI